LAVWVEPGLAKPEKKAGKGETNFAQPTPKIYVRQLLKA
jgi:hypothetical protein